MKEILEKILEVEKENRNKIEQARLQAAETLKQAEAKAVEIIEKTKKEAIVQAQELIQNAKQKAENKKQTIYANLKKQAEEYKSRKETIEQVIAKSLNIITKTDTL